MAGKIFRVTELCEYQYLVHVYERLLLLPPTLFVRQLFLSLATLQHLEMWFSAVIYHNSGVLLLKHLLVPLGGLFVFVIGYPSFLF